MVVQCCTHPPVTAATPAQEADEEMKVG